MPPSSCASKLSKYQVTKTLGQGSFGKALLVKLKPGHSSSSKTQYFVMKEIQVGHLSKKEKEMTLAEATVLASMSHSNICKYVDHFLNSPQNTTLYIVMDWADGGDLSGAITRRKKARRPFSEADVMNMFVQICLALKHVHSRKILHRDLKAQNIFLTKTGVVKLGDFGIAKVRPSRPASHQSSALWLTLLRLG
jgi:NIMA (never in mitosis gene a)-related kinase